MDKWCFGLSIPVNSSIALFEGNERPGNVVIEHMVTKVVQVHSLRACIRGKQDSVIGVLFTKIFNDPLLFYVGEGAMKIGYHAVV